MLTKTTFDNLLASRGTLIIDGALATELESRGHDLNHPLWSGKILREDPASIEKVHLDYYLAGADTAITSSYQTSTQGLQENFGISENEANDLIRRSVQVAQKARDDAYARGVQRKLLVAGSVGPYGAYLHDGSEYRGDYVRTQEEFEDFHRPRIRALVDAGMDLLAIETIPSLSEIEALLGLLRKEFPEAIAWMSFTTRDAGHLADGTSWSEVFKILNEDREHIVAVGVNCVAMAGVTETLQEMKKHTAIPLLCYPNSGETFDSATNSWHGERFEDGSEQRFDTAPWISSGARLIGGCCRTGPCFVRALHEDLYAARR